MRRARKKFRRKFRRNSGTLPGRPKTGRPPGVPWTAPKKNPPIFTDLAEYVLPGFGGFAATKAISRIATSITAKKRPGWAKHVGALSSVATFVALWFLAHRVKQIARYHTPVVVGSAIASLQTLVETYIPKYGWLVATDTSTVYGQAPGQIAAGDMDYEQLAAASEDDDYGIYDDAMEAETPQRAQARGPAHQQAQAKARAANDDLDAMIAELDDEDYQGVFADN